MDKGSVMAGDCRQRQQSSRELVGGDLRGEVRGLGVSQNVVKRRFKSRHSFPSFVPTLRSVTSGTGSVWDTHIEQNRNAILPMLLLGMDLRGDVDCAPEAVC